MHDELYQARIRKMAIDAGCTPEWTDGMLGIAWHCTCRDNRHGADQQCSTITLEALTRVPSR